MSASTARFHSPIVPPGPRLLRRPPLATLRRRPGRRAPELALPLVSLVDCLLCLVLFLLSGFSASAECPERQQVPSAENTRESVEAPLIAITPRHVLLDGQVAAATSELSGDMRAQRIEPLQSQLKAKRELWRQLNPSATFPGAAILQVDRRVPAVVVKSALRTATAAGYHDVSFLVRKR